MSNAQITAFIEVEPSLSKAEKEIFVIIKTAGAAGITIDDIYIILAQGEDLDDKQKFSLRQQITRTCSDLYYGKRATDTKPKKLARVDRFERPKESSESFHVARTTPCEPRERPSEARVRLLEEENEALRAENAALKAERDAALDAATTPKYNQPEAQS